MSSACLGSGLSARVLAFQQDHSGGAERLARAFVAVLSAVENHALTYVMWREHYGWNTPQEVT